VQIEPSTESVAEPRVEWVAPSKFPYGKVTRRLVEGSRGRPSLGESGQKLVGLLAWDPASRPPAQPQGGLSEVAASLKVPGSDE